MNDEDLSKIKLDMPIDYDEPYCNFEKEKFSARKPAEKNEDFELVKAIVGAILTKSIEIKKSF